MGLLRPQAPMRFLQERLPGVLVCVLVALAAKFLSGHYGAPAMLMALLLGIALNFLGEEGRCISGVGFSAQSILRVGVALLGARISADLLMALGWDMIGLVVLGVFVTLLFGLLVARIGGFPWHFGFLTAGAVAICGASAAMAISAVLPRQKDGERSLIFTVLSVTVLSTIAMVLYPVLADRMGFDARQGGVFLGGTIHDVAQVVGAGFSISQETGEASTLVKLVRVTLLAPLVLVASLVLRSSREQTSEVGQPPLVPPFVLAFLGLAVLNSLHWLPDWLVDLCTFLSQWALLVSIAAVGMKTSLGKVLQVGGGAIGLVVAETGFLAAFILVGLVWLS